MLKLEKTLRAWGSREFEAVMKQELAQNAEQLPLQQGLMLSSSVSDAPIEVVIYGVQEQAHSIEVRTGIFYQGLVGGCSCADDPTPDSPNTEYCELLLTLDKQSAIATVILLD
jgi:hypothetical protein